MSSEIIFHTSNILLTDTKSSSRPLIVLGKGFPISPTPSMNLKNMDLSNYWTNHPPTRSYNPHTGGSIKSVSCFIKIFYLNRNINIVL